MKRGRVCGGALFWAVLISTAAISLSSRVMALPPTAFHRGVDVVAGEILVKFKAGVGPKQEATIHARHGTGVLYRSPYAGFERVRIPAGKSIDEALAAFKAEPAVEYAEPNSVCRAHFVPNDPYYRPYQWHLDNPVYGGIEMEQAWDISTGSPSVVVAVIDTGVAYENRNEGPWKFRLAPDLAGTTFVQGHDFVNNDTHPNDDDGHGTHVTGTIAQTTNNGIGTAGVAFNTAIMPVKVLNKNGSGTAQTLADGLYFAAGKPPSVLRADVANMSLGWPAGYNPGSTVENAINYAYNAGVTLVASSGNDGANEVAYPAAYPACIAVGATKYDEQVTYYSNRGDALDLVAPGGLLYNPYPIMNDQNGDGYWDGVLQQTFATNKPDQFSYYFYEGTSMAAPHVSGVAALLVARGVAGPAAVRQILESTAKDKGPTGWDSTYGWGIVNAAAALQTTVVTDTEPPTVPTNLTATAASPSQIDLAWTASTDNVGVAGYRIFREGVHVATTTTTSHSDTGLPPSTTYSYYVVAFDAAGNTSAQSNSAGATTLPPPPGQTMHVASIAMALKRSGINTSALATVAIVDAAGNPVAGANVSGHWSGVTSDTDVGLTDSTGKVTLQSNNVKRAPKGTTFTLSVDNVVLSGWTYDAAANVETSDSITVP
jgi:serine protease